MARSNNLSNFNTDIANAIRNKTGTTEPIVANDFATKIRAIETGTGINGEIATYIAGGTVTRGKFVKLVSNKAQNITSTSDTILGVAKTSGTSGQTIEVVIPNI